MEKFILARGPLGSSKGQATMESLVVLPLLSLVVILFLSLALIFFAKIRGEYLIHESLVCMAGLDEQGFPQNCETDLRQNIEKIPGSPRLQNFSTKSSWDQVEAQMDLVFSSQLMGGMTWTLHFSKNLSLPLELAHQVDSW